MLKKALGAGLAASLVASNIVAAKIASFTVPVIGSVTVPAGFVGVAIAFLISDLLSELYGEAEAREAVNAAIAALGIGWVVAYSAVLMPAAPFYPLADAFNSIIGAGTTIVVSSILTLLVSQNIDVTVFHAIKRVTDIKAARNIGSTAISQAIDTTLFIGLAFVVLPRFLSGDPLPLAAAWALIVAQYAVKLLVVAADTPLFYAVTALHDRVAA